MKFEFKPYPRNVSDEQLLSDLAGVAKLLGTQSPTMEQYDKHGSYSPTTLTKRFGSWSKVLEQTGYIQTRFNAGIDAQTAIEDLKRVSAELGNQSVTQPEYADHGSFSEAPFLRLFGSWNDALKAAGLLPSRRYKIPNEELFANIEQMWRELGRQPKYGEVTKPFSRFSSGTYERRFGNWTKALYAFVAFMETPTADPLTEQLPLVQDVTILPTRQQSPRSVNWRLRFLVMQKDGFRCRLCGRSPATEIGVKLQVDHIEPWSKRGKTVRGNLQTLCETCNIGKSNLPMEVREEFNPSNVF